MLNDEEKKQLKTLFHRAIMEELDYHCLEKAEEHRQKYAQETYESAYLYSSMHSTDKYVLTPEIFKSILLEESLNFVTDYIIGCAMSNQFERNNQN